MISRRLLFLFVAAGSLLAGCTSSGSESASGWHGDGGAAETILLRAEREKKRRSRGADRYPPPPGIDASLLAPRAAADAKARMTLAEAMAATLAEAPPPPGPVAPAPPPPEVADEALRHYIKGRDASLRNRDSLAVLELEKARQLHPTSVPILRSLAHSYASEMNSPRAYALFEQIQSVDPENPEAVLVLGMTAANRREFETAVAILASIGTKGRLFNHDPAGDLLAAYTLHVSLQALGYDRALIEAGWAAAETAWPLSGPSIYHRRVADLNRRRGAIWRSIGDAHCRLGEYTEALRSYEVAVAHPQPDLGFVHDRIVYANLQLGRKYGAQAALILAIRASTAGVTDRDIQLSEYLGNQLGQQDLLTEAIIELHHERPGDAGLARAAALLLPAEQGRELLTAFVGQSPRDVGAVGQLLLSIGERDPAGATALAASLMTQEPDLAARYVDWLVIALREPARTVEELEVATPSFVQVRARVRLKLSDHGTAWAVCRDGLARWPGDEGLLLFQLELAGRMDELRLLNQALDEAANIDSAWSWVLRAQVLRSVDEHERAIAAAERARAVSVREGRFELEALLELARAHMAQVPALSDERDRERSLLTAVSLARQAQALAPDRDDPYEFLVALYSQTTTEFDIRKMQVLLEPLATLNPASHFNERMVARLALRQGRFKAALDRALSLYAVNPTDVDSLDIAVTAWDRLGSVDEAEAWLREQHALHPGDPAPLDRLANLLVSRGRARHAVALLEARQAEFTDDPAGRHLLEIVYSANGRPLEALRLGEVRLRRRPQGVRRELQLASLYARANQSELAFECLEWIRDHAEEAPLHQLNLAIQLCPSLEELGRRRERVTAELVETATEQHDGVPLPMYTVGLRALMRLDESEGRFDAMVTRAATTARGADDGSIQGVLPWRELAQRLVVAGYPAAAAAALRTRQRLARELTPKAVEFLARMTLAAYAVSSDAVAPSIDLLVELEERGVIVAMPYTEGDSIAAAMLGVGRLNALVGNEEGAEQLIRESIRLDPANAMAKNDLGYMRIEAGHGDAETITWIEDALRRAPENTSVIDTMAWLRYKQGVFADQLDQPGSVSLLRRVVETNPDPEVLDHYGDTLWRLGYSEEAIAAWGQVLDILGDPKWRDRVLRNYRLAQRQEWGLLVSDPVAMYDRGFGRMLEQIRRKLEEAARGGDPPVAPTFDELADVTDPPTE